MSSFNFSHVYLQSFLIISESLKHFPSSPVDRDKQVCLADDCKLSTKSRWNKHKFQMSPRLEAQQVRKQTNKFKGLILDLFQAVMSP